MTVNTKHNLFVIFIISFSSVNLFSQNNADENSFFDTYEWLNQEYPNCENVIFTEYDLGAFSFVHGSDGRLFFENGTFYCQDSDVRDCKALYDLTPDALVNEFHCGMDSTSSVTSVFALTSDTGQLGDTVCLDIIITKNQAIISFLLPITYDQQSLEYIPNLCNEEGLINFSCSHIFPSEEGLRYFWNTPDISLPEQFKEDQTILNYCFKIIDDTEEVIVVTSESQGNFIGEIVFQSPEGFFTMLSFPILTATITIEQSEEEEEEEEEEEVTTRSLPIDQYPWIDQVRNNFDCAGLNITEFDLNTFSFFLLTDGDLTQLYFEDGTFYCQNGDNYFCQEIYNLTGEQISNKWSCSDSNAEENANEEENSNNVPSSLIDSYPWLDEIISCDDELIIEYEISVFKYLYVQSTSSLYFQDGTFYCQDSEGRDCRSLYNLSNASNEWACGDNDFTATIDNYSRIDKNSSEVNIYPNPAKDFITVSNSDNIMGVFIYDTTGQLVKGISGVESKELNLNIQDIHSGLYLIRIKTERDTIIKRLIKSDY